VLDIDGFLKEDGVWVKGSSIDFLTTNFGLYVTAKKDGKRNTRGPQAIFKLLSAIGITCRITFAKDPNSERIFKTLTSSYSYNSM
jgi:hypothetical protein